MKKTISIFVFFLLLFMPIGAMNDVLVEKSVNRYFMLSHELKKVDDIDVQIYGSCHAYTSFDASYFTEKYGVDSYNMSNPGEIIPSTYLRMYERFQKDKPRIAVVEIWGVNAYETYEPTEKIFKDYFRGNIEDIPLSWEKLKVMREFEELDVIEDNLAFIKYRNRVVAYSLRPVDFKYSYEQAEAIWNNGEWPNYVYNEMSDRFSNNGYRKYEANSIPDYEVLQASVNDDEQLKVEDNLMKYVEKIIELCEENQVPVIFYRAPYRSTKNELRKTNYLKTYLDKEGIPFYDLEKEIKYDYEQDFYDYEHLSEYGALKATDFLGEKIMKVLN